MGTTRRRPPPRRLGRVLALTLAMLAAAAPAAMAQSGTVTGGKSAAPANIPCDGSALTTVTLTGQTGIAGNPTDIMLVLDRSGSMAGAPLAALKVAAGQFVDIVDQATDGTLNGVIANGSRIGVVSFADGAVLDVALTSSAAAVKAAINGLVAGGLTNHGAAIGLAQGQLAAAPGLDQQMIVFTDGQTTTGPDPDPIAAAARAAGTEIFAIGLGQVNAGQLNAWATDPDATHVFIAPDADDLDAVFQALGAAITVPAATNVKVVDTVHGHFAVTNAAVTKGAITTVGNVLTWTIPTLGSETATLTYRIAHDATKPGGTEQVNTSIVYTDAEGKTVTFPSPTVNVRGCAATIDLAPATATNELGTPGQTHTVTATVDDDFGDPVAGVPVAFAIQSGPNAGANGTGATNASGEAPFVYTAKQGLAGLGTDTIQGCFTNGAGQAVCDTATKRWVDTTAPIARCTPTTNPNGGTVPPATNQDGFFALTAKDAVDADPRLFVRDAGSGTLFGPYASGTRIKYTQAPGATPSEKKIGSPNGQAGAVTVHITGTGDAAVFATDASGNASAPVSCRVPPPPS